ncbi:MAG: hypothetical protein AAF085_06195 [Planctomycetota bacterium]
MSIYETYQMARLPFAKNDVPVVVDIETHPAIEGIEDWPKELKKEIEKACFNSYKDMIERIGGESLPQIKKASEIWKNITIEHIQIDPMIHDAMLIYVQPAWDIDNAMEWCICESKLVYVGPFRGYGPNDYGQIETGNFANS